MPPPAGPRSWTRTVPGAVRVADRRERRAALAHDPRDGGQRLDVVDDGRPAEQAVLGGVRRLLLGLAALALERLQQDRLLAQHVRALDRPDRHVDPVAAAEHVVAEEAGLLGRQRRASSRVTSAVSSARTARIASVAPVAKAAIARPSRTATGRRAAAWRRSGRRVGAVAVGDDVALRPPAGRPRRATSRRWGSRPRPGRGARRRRRSRWSRSAPRSRTAIRRPSNAPSRVARSRSSGSASRAATRPVRTVGQSRGVDRNAVIEPPAAP